MKSKKKEKSKKKREKLLKLFRDKKKAKREKDENLVGKEINKSIGIALQKSNIQKTEKYNIFKEELSLVVKKLIESKMVAIEKLFEDRFSSLLEKAGEKGFNAFYKQEWYTLNFDDVPGGVKMGDFNKITEEGWRYGFSKHQKEDGKLILKAIRFYRNVPKGQKPKNIDNLGRKKKK